MTVGDARSYTLTTSCWIAGLRCNFSRRRMVRANASSAATVRSTVIDMQGSPSAFQGSNKLFKLDWLGDIVVHASLPALLLVTHERMGCHGDNIGSLFWRPLGTNTPACL